jgi:LysM repeat protein
VPRGDWRRYLAPAAFLLAATIAVVLIRSGIESGGSRQATSTAISTTAKKTPVRRFWTVRAGDTFATISRRTGVPVARIRRLNPKIRSASLFIGQKVRVK